jgi:hypothetical protein
MRRGSSRQKAVSRKTTDLVCCLLLSAYCLLPLEVILVIVVERFFLDDIQLNWIQSDDLERNSTLFTIHRLAFVYIEINVDVGITFRARSGRHFFNLQEKSNTCACQSALID